MLPTGWSFGVKIGEPSLPRGHEHSGPEDILVVLGGLTVGQRTGLEPRDQKELGSVRMRLSNLGVFHQVGDRLFVAPPRGAYDGLQAIAIGDQGVAELQQYAPEAQGLEEWLKSIILLPEHGT